MSLGRQGDPCVDKKPGKDLKEGRILRLKGRVKVTNRLRPLGQENVDELINLHGTRDLVVYQVTVILGEHLNEDVDE